MENKLSASLEYGTRPRTHQRQWKWVSFSVFYAYLGTVSFKPLLAQNSAPLLANVIIKLLLKGHNPSPQCSGRTWCKRRSLSTVWTSPSHQTSYTLISYRLLFSCPSHLGLNIVRKPELPAHSHFWNLEGIKQKCQFVTGPVRTGGRLENTIIFLKLKLPDLKDYQ